MSQAEHVQTCQWTEPHGSFLWTAGVWTTLWACLDEVGKTQESQLNITDHLLLTNFAIGYSTAEAMTCGHTMPVKLGSLPIRMWTWLIIQKY